MGWGAGRRFALAARCYGLSPRLNVLGSRASVTPAASMSGTLGINPVVVLPFQGNGSRVGLPTQGGASLCPGLSCGWPFGPTIRRAKQCEY